MNTIADRNILVTGIPRSGTTLLSALLDCPPDSVSIGEPHGLGALQKKYADNHNGFVNRLIEFFSETREIIANGNAILDRFSINGKPLTNYVGDRVDGIRCKEYIIKDRLISNINKEYYLIFKSPVIFTAVLPAIISNNCFKVISIIRNPVSTILSWNSVNFPISNARLPAGELYWPDLGKIVGLDCSVLEKQAMIWELFARRYLDYKKEIILLRYEDLVANPQLASDAIKIPFTKIEMINMNFNSIYDTTKVFEIQEALTKYSPTSKLLYP